MTHLIPEWHEPKGLAIVHPEGLPAGCKDIEALTRVVRALLGALAKAKPGLKVLVVHRSALTTKPQNQLEEEARPLTLDFQKFEKVQDVWIRDFAPIAQRGGKVYKARYAPPYAMKNSFEVKDAYVKLDHAVGRELVDKANLVLDPDEPTLVWDGGNFIHNGAGIGIATDFLLEWNAKQSHEEVHERAKTWLGLDELLIVSPEYGDATGHMDGMMRFLDADTLAIGQYPQHPWKTDGLDLLAEHFSQRFRVVRIPQRLDPTPPKKKKKACEDGVESATGNHMNYLQLGKTIFLPYYKGHAPEHAAARKVLEEEGLEVISFPEKPDETPLEPLSELGGSLHCITWQWY